MPEIKVDVEVWCSCGEGLCHQSCVESRGRGLVVEPCQKCLDASFSEGHEKGYNEGYPDGHEEGYPDGHTKGYSEGFESGCDSGKENQ